MSKCHLVVCQSPTSVDDRVFYPVGKVKPFQNKNVNVKNFTSFAPESNPHPHPRFSRAGVILFFPKTSASPVLKSFSSEFDFLSSVFSF